MQQLVELERLGDEVGRPPLDGVDRILHRGVAGDDDGDDAGITLQSGIDDAAAVNARQAQVGDDDVEGEALQLFEGLLARSGLGNLETLVQEPFRHHPPQRILIVYEENIWFGIRHLPKLSKN